MRFTVTKDREKQSFGQATEYYVKHMKKVICETHEASINIYVLIQVSSL